MTFYFTANKMHTRWNLASTNCSCPQ